MAIDSAEKRLAIMDMDEATMPAIPLTDGSFDAGDRLHLLWLYAFGATPPPPPPVVTRGGYQPIFVAGRIGNR